VRAPQIEWDDAGGDDETAGCQRRFRRLQVLWADEQVDISGKPRKSMQDHGQAAAQRIGHAAIA
jgi:hypothetical protein